MSNTAKEVIIPKESHIFRTIFLYVGQGDATILIIPNGDEYKYVLIDSNNDTSTGGIDLVKMLKDLFDEEDNQIEVYINTHPHSDHLAKIKEIYDAVGIKQVWHSGHKPSEKHKGSYDDLQYVMKKVGEENVFCLKGSTEENKLDDKEVKLGDINYNVLAPAEYISDEIEDEDPDERYRRIHEQCGVIRFRYGQDEKQVLITGDADYTAWKEHITDFHKDRLPSTVLQAAHHGSNSFFWENSEAEGDPYKKHLNNINPTYVVVSAPKQSESKHEHPDDKAMDLYIDKVSADSTFHLGDKRECIVVDINQDGVPEITHDDELVKKYGKKKKSGASGKGGSTITAGVVVPKLDKKPFGKE